MGNINLIFNKYFIGVIYMILIVIIDYLKTKLLKNNTLNRNNKYKIFQNVDI